MKKFLIGICSCLVVIACDRQMVFEQFETIKNQTWNSNDILHFNVNITDTASAHNVYISVRNTGQYEFSNLYMFVTAKAPSGSLSRDTIEAVLANDHGKWLGKGSAAVYTLYQPYRTNIRFPVKGIYRFDIEQAMWINDLKHISHIGLRIEKAKQKR